MVEATCTARRTPRWSNSCYFMKKKRLRFNRWNCLAKDHSTGNSERLFDRNGRNILFQKIEKLLSTGELNWEKLFWKKIPVQMKSASAQVDSGGLLLVSKALLRLEVLRARRNGKIFLLQTICFSLQNKNLTNLTWETEQQSEAPKSGSIFFVPMMLSAGSVQHNLNLFSSRANMPEICITRHFCLL